MRARGLTYGQIALRFRISRRRALEVCRNEIARGRGEDLYFPHPDSWHVRGMAGLS
jgi:hypothetical protein